MRRRMPVFWGNNNRNDRHDHHDHQTHVTSSGAPIVVSAHDGGRHHHDSGHHHHDSGRHHHDSGHHHGGVVAVPATNISTHATGVDRDRRHYRSGREPSTIHGLWNKIIGSLTGNRRRRRRGEREMRRARDHKRALRTARQVERARDTGNMTKLRKFHQRRRRKRSHHRADEPIVIAQDEGRSRRRTPWGHYGNRTLPSYHGAHHRLLGFFSGGRERRARGKAMAIAAEEERRRERRRRREEMRDHGRRFRERGRL